MRQRLKRPRAAISFAHARSWLSSDAEGCTGSEGHGTADAVDAAACWRSRGARLTSAGANAAGGGTMGGAGVASAGVASAGAAGAKPPTRTTKVERVRRTGSSASMSPLLMAVRAPHSNNAQSRAPSLTLQGLRPVLSMTTSPSQTDRVACFRLTWVASGPSIARPMGTASPEMGRCRVCDGVVACSSHSATSRSIGRVAITLAPRQTTSA